MQGDYQVEEVSGYHSPMVRAGCSLFAVVWLGEIEYGESCWFGPAAAGLVGQLEKYLGWANAFWSIKE